MMTLTQKILFLAIAVILISCGAEQQTTEEIEEEEQATETASDPDSQEIEPEKETYVRDLFVAPDDIVLGDPESSVVLMEYFSLTCPHCVHYHKKIFPVIKAKYIDTNKIAYVTREFIANKQDLDATILARCKGDVDHYFKFLDVILNTQDNWATKKNYREILTNIGGLGSISPEEFSKCLNDQKLIGILMENTKLIVKNPDFAGTPSFFINSHHFDGRYTAEELSKALDEYINASRSD